MITPRALELKSGEKLGHFCILDKLGSGGMGGVYLAEDLGLQRKVAIKLLPPEVTGNAEQVERFTREARLLAALDHTNIVTVYSVEEAEGLTCDHRSDLFSLGVILYEMATGRRPFAGSSPTAVISAILCEDPPTAKASNPSLPTELDALIRTCLAKTPQQRVQTAVLEGSVHKSGSHLRVTAQLINAADGYHLWSERFDREMDDLFAIQDELSLAIVAKLKVTLLQGERSALLKRHTADREAHQLYLRGRYVFNRRHAGDFERALGLFQQASERDPDFASPWSARAEIYLVLGVWGFVSPREAAEKAIALEPGLADAHLILGYAALFYHRDTAEANQHLERAFALKNISPLGRLWAGYTLIASGQAERVLTEMKKAIEADPLSPVAYAVASVTFIFLDRIDEALEHLRQAIDLDPAMPIALHWLGICLGILGENQKGLEALRRAMELGFTPSTAAAARLLAQIGRHDEARRLLEGLKSGSTERYEPFFPRSLAYLALGERETARSLFRRAVLEREPGVVLAHLGKLFMKDLADLLSEDELSPTENKQN